MTIPSIQTPDDPSLSADITSHVLGLVEENRLRNQRRHSTNGGLGEIRSIGVVGAGFLGSSVAAAAVEHGCPVVITDRDEPTLRGALNSIHNALTETRGTVDTTLGASIAELVRMTDDVAEVADCDLVVETVVENPRIKQQVFAELEAHRNIDTIIVTNTSTLPIGQLASNLDDPTRFCGLHFFPPLGEQPMLEIIPGTRTSSETTAKVVEFSEAIGRLPVVVPDGRGFVVNRLIMAYMSAGIRLLAVGVDVQRIDRAALDFGMRLGPIRFYDEIGLDVALNSAWSLAAESDSLVARSPVLVRLVKAKQLGRKTGRGFFVHRAENVGETAGDVNVEAARLIAQAVDGEERLSDQELTSAIVLPVLLEATRILEEGRARDAGQIDLAAMFGLGFPVWRGGLLFWADQVGAGTVATMLESLSRLGPHLQPTQSLSEIVDLQRRFYDLPGDMIDRRPTPAVSTATKGP
jgi:3-hydroxyacyl-CoA dehydrogenase